MIFNENYYENGKIKLSKLLGSGCGLLGRAVASNTRDQWFKCNNQQILFTINLIEIVLKRQKKKKRYGNANFLKRVKISNHGKANTKKQKLKIISKGQGDGVDAEKEKDNQQIIEWGRNCSD